MNLDILFRKRSSYMVVLDPIFVSSWFNSPTFPSSFSLDPCKDVKCDFFAKCLGLADDSTVCRCSLDCSPNEVDLVCGSDGITYLSECHLQTKICQERKPISVATIGICREYCLLMVATLKGGFFKRSLFWTRSSVYSWINQCLDRRWTTED